MLIGRQNELESLTAVLERAADGQSGVALISGDAGVGKTRLISELTAKARAGGWTVLAGQCAELGESIPYLPLAEALRTGGEAVYESLRSRPVLGRLLPDGTDGDSAGPVQQQLFGATLSLLGEIAERRPVLFVLEDLHWADGSTRQLLTFLSRVLQRERVCVVGTYRSDDLHRRHPLRPVVAELLRLPGVTGIHVKPLGRAETADYLASLGPAPSSDMAGRIFERSEGNPFYAAELYEAADEGDIPVGLSDLLLARVERLSDDAQRIVRVAAVAGKRIGDELIRNVSGLDEQACERALREVVSHQLLLPQGDGYLFRHALLREAIYGDLLPGENTRLHATFAKILLDEHGPAAELAHHSFAAHDLPRAFAASVEAGKEAERVGAPGDAHEHYDRALSLWEVVPDAEALAGTDRAHLGLMTVQAATNAGETRLAVTRLKQLLELTGPDDVLLQAELYERLAYNLTDIDRDGEAYRISRKAVGLVPADPPTPLRARTLATAARTGVWGDPDGDFLDLANEALRTAQAVGALGAEASALVSLGLFLESTDSGTTSVDNYTAAAAIARQSGDPQIAQRADYQLSRCLFDKGDLAAASRAVDEAVGYSNRLGLSWSPYGTSLRTLRFLIHYTAGDWGLAASEADRFPTRVATFNEAILSSYALFLDVARGAAGTQERISWLEKGLNANDEEYSFITFVSQGLAAERDLFEGDPESAVVRAQRSADSLSPTHPARIRIAATALWAQADLAIRARSAGRSDEAARAAADVQIGEARRNADFVPDGRRRVGLGCEGKAWLARAEAEWHRTYGDDTPEMWRAVAEAFDYGFDYEVARSRWRLAESLMAHGERNAAAEEWRLATATAERLGARPLLAALTDLGTRARFIETRSVEARSGLLTSREQEVFGLLAEGRTNKEIAAALFISPKTASVHVSNILTKLGVATRTEAAAAFHKR